MSSAVENVEFSTTQINVSHSPAVVLESPAWVIKELTSRPPL